MTGVSSQDNEQLQRAAGGDQEALRALLAQHHDRLKRMVHLRLSRRLAARVDDSDVLQEAYIEVARRLNEYVKEPSLPFFLWLRHMTGLKLAEVHRRHLGTQQIDGAVVTAGFFRTLGVTPVLGRDFDAGADRAEAPRTILLSYAAWQKRYGGRKDVLGRTVELDGKPQTIIGVLPQRFRFLDMTDLGILLPLRPKTARGYNSFAVARLKPGATLALRLECTVEELMRTIHAHPTMSEAVLEAAHAAHGAPIHA